MSSQTEKKIVNQNESRQLQLEVRLSPGCSSVSMASSSQLDADDLLLSAGVVIESMYSRLKESDATNTQAGRFRQSLQKALASDRFWDAADPADPQTKPA